MKSLNQDEQFWLLNWSTGPNSWWTKLVEWISSPIVGWLQIDFIFILLCETRKPQDILTLISLAVKLAGNKIVKPWTLTGVSIITKQTAVQFVMTAKVSGFIVFNNVYLISNAWLQFSNYSLVRLNTIRFAFLNFRTGQYTTESLSVLSLISVSPSSASEMVWQ